MINFTILRNKNVIDTARIACLCLLLMADKLVSHAQGPSVPLTTLRLALSVF